MNKITYEQFATGVWRAAMESPEYIRNGQAIFNYIDEQYGVARTVQFDFGVDCFYDDSKISKFIELSWKLIDDMQNERLPK